MKIRTARRIGMVGGVTAAVVSVVLVLAGLAGNALGQEVSPQQVRDGWIGIGCALVALVGAHVVTDRPGVGALAMLGAALALLYASVIFVALPIPLLVVASIIGFRNVPPAK